MQYTPRTLIAMINAGDRDAVLAANTMWACVSCYLCTTRCPQNIPITEIIYALKRMSIAEGRYSGTDAPALAKTFTGFVDKYGRSYEAGLATGYHLLKRWKPLEMMKMGPMGMKMFFRGRMALLPTKIRQIEQLQAIIRKAKELSAQREAIGQTVAELQIENFKFAICQFAIFNWSGLVKYAYYPGCSLECNAAAYDHSVREVADLLDIKLQTLDDWNCCGATEYFSQDELTACAVIARNLALVEPQLRAACGPLRRLLPEPEKDRQADDRSSRVRGEGEPVPGRRRIELPAGPGEGAAHAGRDRGRHRRGGRPRQARPAA